MIRLGALFDTTSEPMAAIESMHVDISATWTPIKAFQATFTKAHSTIKDLMVFCKTLALMPFGIGPVFKTLGNIFKVVGNQLNQVTAPMAKYVKQLKSLETRLLNDGDTPKLTMRNRNSALAGYMADATFYTTQVPWRCAPVRVGECQCEAARGTGRFGLPRLIGTAATACLLTPPTAPHAPVTHRSSPSRFSCWTRRAHRSRSPQPRAVL